MSQYLLINRIQVQGANAVAGFTWGFPAITHFLGFTHHLSIKLNKRSEFSGIGLSGCAVIAHQHQVHTYGYNQFIQSKNPAYQYKEESKNKVGSPPVIEEGKMNMTVSLLIGCEGNVGNRKDAFIAWLDRACKKQRLAGGTILDIGEVTLFTVDDENSNHLRTIIRKLLPGFILQDRSEYLEKHFYELQSKNAEAELFDAWLDFIALKQKARPVSDGINRHLMKQAESTLDDEEAQSRLRLWQEHLDQPFEKESIPGALKEYFETIPENSGNKKLLAQWRAYCSPDEKADAVWEYLEKPEQGFLVPIMTGYKAISEVYPNNKVANTRDNKTDVCFVEAVHSIGEWQGVHRIRDEQALRQSLWHYDYHKNWYLCKQGGLKKGAQPQDDFQGSSDDDFSDWE